jgi:uncharacterized protein (TIGR01244 family)
MLGICSEDVNSIAQVFDTAFRVGIDARSSEDVGMTNHAKLLTLGLATILLYGISLAAPTTVPSTAPSARADDKLAPATCGKIARLHRLADVYLAGQPSPEDLAEAKKLGIKTVINLRPDAENKAFNEREAVEAAGLAYVHIPFAGPDEATDAVFGEARKQLKAAERPILLHCGTANRVGAVWLPYRVLDNGIAYDAALAEAKTIGLRNPALEAKAKDYVVRQQK